MNLLSVIGLLLAFHAGILAAFIGSAPRRDRQAKLVMTGLLLTLAAVAGLTAAGGRRFDQETTLAGTAILALWLAIAPMIYCYVRLRTGGARLKLRDGLHLIPTLVTIAYAAALFLWQTDSLPWVAHKTVGGLLTGLYLVLALCYLGLARRRLTGPTLPGVALRDMLRGATAWWFRALLASLTVFVAVDGAASAVVLVTGAGAESWHLSAVSSLSFMIFTLAYVLLLEPVGLLLHTSARDGYAPAVPLRQGHGIGNPPGKRLSA